MNNMFHGDAFIPVYNGIKLRTSLVTIVSVDEREIKQPDFYQALAINTDELLYDMQCKVKRARASNVATGVIRDALPIERPSRVTIR